MGSLQQYYWLVEFFLGIVFLVTLYVVTIKAVKVAERGFRKKVFIEKEKWKKTFFPALKVIFISLAIYYALSRTAASLGFRETVEAIKPIRDCLIVLSFSWIAYKFKEHFMRRISLVKGHGLSKVLSIVIVVTTALAILSIFDVDIVPFLAFGGIGAALLGFAAKDAMSSLFSGMVLAMVRSFNVGDLIMIPEKNLEGFIEEMGWNTTLVRSKDRCAVYVPNSLFSQLLVINLSQRTGRRILETFHLRHVDFDKLFIITSEVKEFLHQYPSLDPSFPVLVFMSATGKYSVDFSIDVYSTAIPLPEHVVVKEEILQNISEIILRHGAKLAHPVVFSETPNSAPASTSPTTSTCIGVG